MTTSERITVEAWVNAPVESAWLTYTSPDDIRQWNFASPDWHCPSASVDLREGGSFTSRMEARDGSTGFDFAGTYTSVVPGERLAYRFGDRAVEVEFRPQEDGTLVRVAFDPETEHPLDQQREGWQAILDNFAAHAGRSNAGARTT